MRLPVHQDCTVEYRVTFGAIDMNWKNTTDRYSKVSIILHWLMLGLMVATYACIELRELYPKGSDPREALKTWHFMLGLTIFWLVWLRIAARVLGGSVPRIEPALKAWQTAAAHLVHALLYGMMIGLPLAGWVMLSAAGKPVPFFGLELPALTGENTDMAKQIKGIHKLVGEAGYYLIGLHALAAVVHHHLQRDNTLTRMLPARH